MSVYRRGRSELAVGAYALASIVVFVLLFGGLTSRGLIRTTTDLYIRLPAADGLLKGDAVLFRGVPVGEVRAIEFGARGDVVVRAKLRRKVPLARDASAALAPVDMFGRQAIVLRSTGEGGTGLADGDTLVGTRPAPLAGRVESLGRQAERFLGDRTLSLLHDALSGVGGAGDEVSHTTRRAADVLTRHSEQLEALIASTDSLVSGLAAAAGPAETRALLSDLRRAATHLNGSAARAEGATAAVARLLDRLERGEGSLGRALTDDALYERTLGAVTELEALIADVRANPGRYVTVRVF